MDIPPHFPPPRRRPRAPLLAISAAPTVYIPAAEDHGGLGLDDIGFGSVADVTVMLDPYRPYKAGDIVVLRWDGHEIGRRSMTPADDDHPIAFAVARAVLRSYPDGMHQLVAHFIPYNADPSDSPPYLCYTKTQRPGGYDPDPASETVNENLALPSVRPTPPTDDLDHVRVVFPPYENMAVGDYLYAWWAGHVLPPAPEIPTPLTEDDLEKEVLEVSVPRAVIEEVGGGDIPIRYGIVDRVGNNSLFSRLHVEEVPIEDPGAPPAPWIEDTVDDEGKVLRLPDLGRRDGVVVVAAHGGMKDEQIRVHWAAVVNGNAMPSYLTEWKVLSADDDEPRFTIPNDYIAAAVDGSARVIYEVATSEVPRVSSKRRTLWIEGPAPSLYAPRVEGTPGQVLDAANHRSGASMAAPSQPGRIPAGSIVVFMWHGRVDGQAEAYADGKNDTRALLTYVNILALVGEKVRVWYQVGGVASGEIELDVIDSDADGLLPAPSVEGLQGGILDPDLPESAVIVDGSVLAIDDTVTFDWSGPAPATGNATVQAPGSVRFPIASSIIQGNANALVSVVYTRRRAGESTRSRPLDFRVGWVEAPDAVVDFESTPFDALPLDKPVAIPGNAIVLTARTSHPGFRVQAGGETFAPPCKDHVVRVPPQCKLDIELTQPRERVRFGIGGLLGQSCLVEWFDVDDRLLGTQTVPPERAAVWFTCDSTARPMRRIRVTDLGGGIYVDNFMLFPAPQAP